MWFPHSPMLRRWVLGFLCCNLLALISASRIHLIYLYSGNPLPFSRVLRAALVDWYAWGAMVPLIVWLVKRFPLERGRWARPAAIHLTAAVVLTLAKMAAEHAVNQAIAYSEMRRLSLLAIQPHFLTYMALLGVVFAASMARASREHQLAASRLEASLSDARLQALRSQLHPHFLFNTLQAISTLMRRDVAAADAMLLRLSDLLRLTLERGERQEVPLRLEMEFVDRYLEILAIRFQDRLAVRRQIAPEALDALVPTMILQPVVENAVRHGIAHRPEGGRLDIGAQVLDGRLRLTVRDDGPGIPAGAGEAATEAVLDPASGARSGTGLANTRSRLRAIHGEAHSLMLRNGETGGVEAILEMPLRRLPGDSP